MPLLEDNKGQHDFPVVGNSTHESVSTHTGTETRFWYTGTKARYASTKAKYMHADTKVGYAGTKVGYADTKVGYASTKARYASTKAKHVGTKARLVCRYNGQLCRPKVSFAGYHIGIQSLTYQCSFDHVATTCENKYCPKGGNKNGEMLCLSSNQLCAKCRQPICPCLGLLS